MSEQFAGWSACSDVAGLDGNERLDRDIDYPAVFGGKYNQALLQGFRLPFDRCLAGGTKRGDGVCNRVVETTV